MAFDSSSFEKQISEESCGPAVLRMMLRSVGIEPESVQQLCSLLGVTEASGTTIESFSGYLAEQARRHAKKIVTAENMSLSDLEHYLLEGYVVAVSFVEPVHGHGHFAIVKSLDNQSLLLADPYFGDSFRVRVEDFQWSSKYEHPPRYGWLCAISNGAD